MAPLGSLAVQRVDSDWARGRGECKVEGASRELMPWQALMISSAIPSGA